MRPLLKMSLLEAFSTGWSVFATLPFKALEPLLEGRIPVYIVVWKSTSKNARNKMSCSTLPSRLQYLFYDIELSHLHTVENKLQATPPLFLKC